MINTVDVRDLDPLINVLSQSQGKIAVYFPLYLDSKTADYSAEISWLNRNYEYTFGGHGIGTNHVHISNQDGVIEQILSDNERFNAGDEFHFEIWELKNEA